MRILQFQQHQSLLFVEFWSLIERTVSESPIPARASFDDVDCLRFLRDQILNELSKSSGVSTPQISHIRLMSILHSVREKAAAKSTWDEAIQSSAGSGVRVHSISAISTAIKVMLEEYLESSSGSEDEEPEAPPSASPKVTQHLESTTPRSVYAREIPASTSPKVIEQFQSNTPRSSMSAKVVEHEEIEVEIDELKAKLTEAECNVSRLLEENLALAKSKAEEAAQLKRQLDNANQQIVEMKGLTEKNLDEIKRLNERVSQFEIPLDIGYGSLTSLPTMEEWKATLVELNRLRLAVGEEKSSLLSQIQTLEVQKNDAEAELSRVRSARPPPSVAGSVRSSTRKFCVNTVSVHGTETCSTRRSSVAEQFVDLVSPNRTIIHVDEFSKPKSVRKHKSGSKNEQCVQQ